MPPQVIHAPLHPRALRPARPVILGPGDRGTPAPTPTVDDTVDDAPERVNTTHTAGIAAVVPASPAAPLTPAQRLRAQLLRHADEARALADAVARDCADLSAADAPYAGRLVDDAGRILDGIAGACGLARKAG